MVQEDVESHGLPGMNAELRQTYDQMAQLGATNPSAARPTSFLAKKLHMGRHKMEHDLRQFEGKGLAAHTTVDGEEAWYLKRAA